MDWEKLPKQMLRRKAEAKAIAAAVERLEHDIRQLEALKASQNQRCAARLASPAPDLATQIVTALFDMSDSAGGLIKDKAITRAREIIALHVQQGRPLAGSKLYGGMAGGGKSFAAEWARLAETLQSTEVEKAEAAAITGMWFDEATNFTLADIERHREAARKTDFTAADNARFREAADKIVNPPALIDPKQLFAGTLSLISDEKPANAITGPQKAPTDEIEF